MIIFLEIVMMSLCAILCTYASISDIKYSIVSNKSILICIILGLVLDVFYYGWFRRDLVTVFLINLVIIFICSICIYALDLWAAGDAKLMMAIALILPAGIFGVNDFSIVSPLILAIMIAFSLAFISIVIESLVLRFVERDFSVLKIKTSQVITYFKSFAYCSLYMTLFVYCLQALFPVFGKENPGIFSILMILFSISMFKFSFFRKKIVLVGSAMILVFLILLSGGVRWEWQFPWKSYLCLAALLFLRKASERYNYKCISTQNVKSGMILAYATIVKMSASRITGLPVETTEDLRSRLTEEQVESIKRWEHSKYGCTTVTIVRKIPFALFVSIGTALTICMFRR